MGFAQELHRILLNDHVWQFCLPTDRNMSDTFCCGRKMKHHERSVYTPLFVVLQLRGLVGGIEKGIFTLHNLLSSELQVAEI